jgi:Lysyl oxidase
MTRRIFLAAVIAAVVTLLAFAVAAVGPGSAAPKPPPPPTGPLPDMQTVVPQHLQLHSAQQREFLRFSNGIANTGPGPWALRPDPPVAEATTTTTAVQEIRSSNAAVKCGEERPGDPCYTIVSERPTGTFEFHPQHNHWHIGDVALFEVRRGSPTGPVAGGISVKTTFCLIDWYKLEGNSNSPERVFFDCETSYQGIQSGWVDQYHQSLDGQELDLTGIPSRNDYYLVSTANPAGIFSEVTRTNNTAWVRFRLFNQGNGGRAVEVTAHSPCSSPGLCGVGAPNR